MTIPPEAETRLLSFLDGSMSEGDREDLLAELDADPELARSLREVARGLSAVSLLGTRPDDTAEEQPPAATHSRSLSATTAGPRVSPWWAVAASFATLLVSWPLATRLAADGVAPADDEVSFRVDQPMPPEADPSFVLVLHGTWPDAGTLSDDEALRRGEEYWAWTGALASSGVLVAAGDLRWEPGQRLAPTGVLTSVDAASVQGRDFVVGMFAVRVATYEEALAVARDCPHLQYGGSVSVRQVGGGFVTVPGMDDWSE